MILIIHLIVYLRVKNDVNLFFNFYVITYFNSINVFEYDFFVRYNVFKYFKYQVYMFKNYLSQIDNDNFFRDENI